MVDVADGAHSADDQRVAALAMTASALAGRVVAVVRQEPGAPAWTDGRTIYLDPTADAGATLRSLGVQACLIAAGSLDNDVIRGLARKPKAAQRYLYLEGHRALAAGVDVLPPALAGLAESAVAAWTDSPAASFEIAIGTSPLDGPPAHFGALHPKRVVAAAEKAAEKSAAADHEAVGHVPRRDAARELEELDGGEEPADGPDPFSSPVGGGGFIGKWLKKMLGSTRAGGAGGGPPGADSPTHRTNVANRSAHAVASAAAALGDDGVDVSGHGVTYPEWDANRRRYRPAWCTVRELDPTVDPSASAAIDDAIALRRPLARLGLGLHRARRQAQGDDIDVDAAVEARVEIRAGSAPEEAVYLDSLRRRRDLSVLVLLDVSGSAAEAGSRGRTVHQQQRTAAANLVVALHDLGDRVALYAYNSHGRSAVNVVPVKTFDEPLDSRTLMRLNSLEPVAYSRLGAAVRHGSAVLERSGGTTRRLLLVVSDGMAYDHGYELGYGAADARRALTEARRRGIGCVCLTVGAAVDAASLQRVFGTAAHATVARPEGLVGVIGPMFRSALRGADVRRRVS